jgi:hypothetical protein
MAKSDTRQVPLIVAVSGTLVLATGLAAGVAVAAVWAITWPSTPSLTGVPDTQRISLLQLALAASAFIGGVVALTVAYRRQRLAEAAHKLAVAQEEREDARSFNERFGSATAQLGHEKSAVRLAGVYAVAGLADDWEAQRQVCVDVLCAYLRMPYDAANAPLGEAEVRRTIMRTIADHPRANASKTVSWTGLDLDFTGAVLEAASFVRANFRNSAVLFDRATFTGRRTTFHKAKIEDATLFFRRATFEGNDLSFESAFIGPRSTLNFEGANISTTSFRFSRAHLQECRVSLIEAQIQTEIEASESRIENSVFAHSADWTPPPSIAQAASVETIDDLWRQYGPPAAD